MLLFLGTWNNRENTLGRHIIKGVYREEGMQLTMTIRTHQTLYQRPDMLKIESSEQVHGRCYL